MELHARIFCLLLCFKTYGSSNAAGCAVLPKEENAEMSPGFLKGNYSAGDKLEYSCKLGYASLRKITYICDGNRWNKLRETECTLKRCELPADIPNGQYSIVNGNNFVLGTTIKYTCRDGFQISTRYDSRTCRIGGWDNQLPVCEETTCVPDHIGDNIKVEGLPDYGDLIKYGHRLKFSCDDEKQLILRGVKEVICQSNGEWSSPFPKCEEVTCIKNVTEDNIIMERIPDQEGSIKYGHMLKFSCKGQGLILKGKRNITCQANGEWSDPYPKCEEVTCPEEELNNVQILVGHPGITPPYKSGQILVFRCTDVNMKMYGQQTIECQSNGKWDNPYPQCGEVTCPEEELNNVQILAGHPGISPPYKSGQILVFRCMDLNIKMYGQQTIECQANGKWNNPYPQCGATCVPNIPRDIFKVEGLPPPGVLIRPGHILKLSCARQGLFIPGNAEITCQSDGKWSPLPICVERSHCEEPPSMNHENADTKVITRKEYNSGEKVEYVCFNKYVMEGDRHLTCVQGEWRGHFTCLKPCTVTVDEMDKKNIELMVGGREKTFSPHKDYITFVCQRHKRPKGYTSFRQMCQNGVMLLPECV
ncbi:complement factor H-like isoform X5 [Myxocyprinus asiaticus]|uniref:complement factor H-like isoform X5 n=1 Tax=Myxocyprinus asiaticus TaxID=70543 RepID=UPI002222A349|nr:complement factor H-like isoform X5 [Myxocyprinus asiaticus]